MDYYAIKRKDSRNLYLKEVGPEKFNGINKYQFCNLEEATPFTESQAQSVLDEVSLNKNETQNTEFIMVPVETVVVRIVTKVK